MAFLNKQKRADAPEIERIILLGKQDDGALGAQNDRDRKQCRYRR
jgi:hypothetical protein